MQFLRKYGLAIFLLAFFVIIYIIGQNDLVVFSLADPNVSQNKLWLAVIIGVSALVDSVNPCAFSILFLTIAFLFSLERDRKHIVAAGLTYIFGIFLTYTLIGVGLLRVLSFFNVTNGLAKLGAVIIILFGLVALINEFYSQFPIKLKIPDFIKGKLAIFIEKGTVPAAFVLGVLVGMFEFPCTGGPYLFVLSLLHDNTSVMEGAIYLIVYNFLFVFPLIVALILASNDAVASSIDNFRRSETRKARLSLALIMIALGLFIFLI